ncbi:hypothetical protein ACOME3_008249 [Neoechinorhynchus agilis]
MENHGKDAFLKEPLSPMRANDLRFTSENDTMYILRHIFNSHCVQGDFGFWQFEFCYGYWVRQFHQFAQGATHSIVLGRWNQEKHIDWYKNVNIANDPDTIILYYSDGDSCAAIAGHNRNVRVLMRCVKTKSEPVALTGQVTTNDERIARGLRMRLHEPTSCSYVLVMESPAFCLLRDFVDKDTGLINTGAVFVNEIFESEKDGKAKNEKIEL